MSDDTGLEELAPLPADNRPWTPGIWHVIIATQDVDKDVWDREWSISVMSEGHTHTIHLATLVQDDFAEYNAKLMALSPMLAEAVIAASELLSDYEFEDEDDDVLQEYIHRAADNVWEIIYAGDRGE